MTLMPGHFPDEQRSVLRAVALAYRRAYRAGASEGACCDAALAELIAKNGEVAAYQIAEVYAYRNDRDKAFEWLERARRQRDAGIPGLRPDLLLKNLHEVSLSD